ncbi:MAG: type II toxin-antitoxin system VapC family toxin [Synechococcales cyanobacterium RM1_1_8]|nr:type II toxin-antitoxin system VapC family toxin [Synechococcales cyanobacterium RM1_1_8]
MYLLDTNICIAINNGDRPVIRQFSKNLSDCYINSVVLSELYKGVFCSQQTERNLAVLERLLLTLEIVDFARSAALHFGQIQAELRRLGRPTGDLDAAIAATARSRDDILVTNNTRHFENILNLRLENWLFN